MQWFMDDENAVVPESSLSSWIPSYLLDVIAPEAEEDSNLCSMISAPLEHSNTDNILASIVIGWISHPSSPYVPDVKRNHRSQRTCISMEVVKPLRTSPPAPRTGLEKTQRTLSMPSICESLHEDVNDGFKRHSTALF